MTFDENANSNMVMHSPGSPSRRTHNKSIEIRKFKEPHLSDFER